jgi:hypothetical protein
VQPVDRLGRHLHGRVEAEGHVGRAEVVVDRLRHAEHGEPGVVELRCGAQRVLAPDRDQPIEAMGVQVLPDSVDAVLALERVRARGTQDSAASRQDSAH